MKLTVVRNQFGTDATNGMLFIDGIFECYTLEDHYHSSPYYSPFLKPMVSNHIAKVIIVAKPVTCWADPVNVSVAITKPTKVQLRFSVSLIASTSQDHNFLITSFS